MGVILLVIPLAYLTLRIWKAEHIDNKKVVNIVNKMEKLELSPTSNGTTFAGKDPGLRTMFGSSFDWNREISDNEIKLELAVTNSAPIKPGFIERLPVKIRRSIETSTQPLRKFKIMWADIHSGIHEYQNSDDDYLEVCNYLESLVEVFEPQDKHLKRANSLLLPAYRGNASHLQFVVSILRKRSYTPIEKRRLQSIAPGVLTVLKNQQAFIDHEKIMAQSKNQEKRKNLTSRRERATIDVQDSDFDKSLFRMKQGKATHGANVKMEFDPHEYRQYKEAKKSGLKPAKTYMVPVEQPVANKTHARQIQKAKYVKPRVKKIGIESSESFIVSDSGEEEKSLPKISKQACYCRGAYTCLLCRIERQEYNCYCSDAGVCFFHQIAVDSIDVCLCEDRGVCTYCVSLLCMESVKGDYSDENGSAANSWLVSIKEWIVTACQNLKDNYFIRVIVELTTPLAIFVYQILRSRNALDITAAIAAFLNNSSTIWGAGIKMIQNKLFTMIEQAYVMFQSKFIPSESLDGFKNVVSGINTFWHSQFVTSITSLIAAVCASAWFPAMDFKTAKMCFGKAITSMSIMDFIPFLFRQLSNVIKFGERLWNGESISEVILGGDPYLRVHKDSEELLYYTDKLYTGVPVEGLMCYKHFISQIDLQLQRISELPKYKKCYDEKCISLVKLKNRLLTSRTTAEQLYDSARRPMPIWLVLTGASGIGKGDLLMFFSALYCKAKGIDFHPSIIFTRQMDSDYWEGFKSYMHRIIHYSELGSTNVEIAKKIGDDRIKEILSLVDVLPYYPNFAFGDKGKIPCLAELIISDTNNSELNLSASFNNPAAFRKRAVFIEARVKPEFRREGLPSLDPAKSLQADDGFVFDRYLFTIWKEHPVTNTITRRQTLLADADIFKTSFFMSTFFEDHISMQEDVRGSLSANYDVSSYVEHKSNKDYDPRVPVDYSAVDQPVFVDDNIDVERLIEPESNEDYKHVWDRLEHAVEFSWQVIQVLVYTLCCIYTGVLLRNCNDADFYIRYTVTLGLLYPLLRLRIVLFLLILLGVCHVISKWVTFDRMLLVGHYALKTRKANSMHRARVLLRKEPHRPLHTGTYNANHLAFEAFFGVLAGSALTFWGYYFGKKYGNKSETVINDRVQSETMPNYTTMWTSASDESENKFVSNRTGDPYQIVNNHPVESQAASNFIVPTPVNEEINNLEEVLECAGSYTRVNVKGHQLWNAAIAEEAKAVFTSTPRELHVAILRNVRYCSVRVNGIVRGTYILGVCDNFALINTHAIREKNVYLCINTIPGVVGSTATTMDTLLDRSDIVDLGDDISLVSLGSIRFRDITKFFIDIPNFKQPRKGFFRDIEVSVSRILEHRYLHYSNELQLGTSNLVAYCYPQHSKGMCGIPVIITGIKGSVICAIHAGGADSFGYGTIVTAERLSAGILRLKQQVVLLPPVSSAPIPIEHLEIPCHKSAFRYEVAHAVEYYGKAPGKILANKVSKLEYTPFHDDIGEILNSTYGFVRQVLYDRPPMRSFVRDGIYYSPYNRVLNKLEGKRIAVNKCVLSATLQTVLDHIIPTLDSERTKLKPLTLMDAINGPQLDDYIRSINVKTSCGFFANGKKSNHLPRNGPNPDSPREASELLKRSILVKMRKYMTGETVGMVFEANLKDEPRDVEKCKIGKTRVFYAMALDDLVLIRMFLSPILSLMVEHGELFGCCVGIDTHRGAHAFVQRMLSFSDIFIELDFADYDITSPAELRRAACTILYVLAKRYGYNDSALTILWGILSDLQFPIISMLLDIFVTSRIWPSGTLGTAELNGFVLLLILVYVWHTVPELKDKNFFSYVQPNNYGDDSLSPVKRDVIEYYNNQVIAKRCERFFGMKCTPAQKQSVMAPYLTINTCSFLKRTFKWHSCERWVAVLGPDTFFKMLDMLIPSESIVYEDQLVSVATTALWELFPLSTEKQFSTMREYFNTKLQLLDSVLPTYSYLYEQYFTAPDKMGVLEQNTSSPLITGTLHDGENVTCNALVQCESTLLNVSYDYTLLTINTYNHATTDPITSIGYQILNRRFDMEKEIELMQAQVDAYKRERDMLTKELIGVDLNEAYHDERYQANSSYRWKIRKHKELSGALEGAQHSLASLKKRRRRIRIVAESSEQKDGVITTADTEQNLLDVAGNDPVSVSGGFSVPFGQGEQNILQMGDYLNRPVLIEASELPLNTDVYIRIKPWDLYTSVPAIRAKLRNYAYLRATMKIRVAISGTPFHYGRVLVSMQPYADSNDLLQQLELQYVALTGGEGNLLAYLSQSMGSTIMSYNENTPVDLTWPFISHKPMFRLFNDSSVAVGSGTSFQDMVDAGDLYIQSFNKPLAASASATNIYIRVYAWLEDVQLGTNTGTQLVIATESDERKTGPVEEMASSMVSISDHLSQLPVISPYAMASKQLFSGFRNIAALLGWSKPVTNERLVQIKQQIYSNGAETIGTDCNKRIVLDPKQELTIDGTDVGSPYDDMVISTIASRWSYVGTYSWASTDVPFSTTPIFSSRVTPMIGYTTSDAGIAYVVPSAMCFAAVPFEFWRGSIEFRIEFCPSAFHRGKIAFWYEPNISHYALVNANISTHKNFMRVIDIQETQVVSFCIPWASYRAWAKVCGPNGVPTSLLDPGNTSYAVGYTNGYIACTPFTELQSPDGSAIPFNVFVRCTDLSVNGLTELNMPQYRAIKTESMEVNCHNSVPITCYDLNDSTATDTNISVRHFGEQPISFRALMKRYITTNNVATPATGAGQNTVLYNSPIFLPDNLPLGFTSATWFDLISYLRYSYLGFKGGIRKRLRMIPASSISGSEHVKVSLDNPTNTYATPGCSTVGLIASRNTLNGTVVFCPFTNGGVECEFPFYTNNLFLFAFSAITVGNVANGNIETTFFRNYTASFETSQATASGIVTEETATAEDFTMMRFMGATQFASVP